MKDYYRDFVDRVVVEQIEYQKKLDNGTFPRLDGKFVNIFALGMIAELGEVLQEFKGWKQWKNSDCTTYNRDKVLDEMMDVFLFYVNLCLSLDITVNEFISQYDKTREKLNARLRDKE